MRRSLLLAVVVLWSLGCARTSHTPSSATPSLEEYKVYSAVIRDEPWLFSGSSHPIIVIEADASLDGWAPSLDDSVRSMRKAFPTLKADTVEDFVRKASHPAMLTRRLSIPAQYVLVQKSELEGIIRGARGWEEYSRRYPGSAPWTKFSRIGISRDVDQAVLCRSESQGDYVLLSKVHGAWKVQKTQLAWIQ